MTERKSLPYYVLDVFSDMSYQGNPLPVVFTEGDLELHEYQNISREFGYSETSFVYYSEEQKALDVRSFTPAGFEVGAGGGHNLLGAAGAALLRGMPIFAEQDDTKSFVMMKGITIFLTADFDAVNQTAVIRCQQKPAIAGNKISLGEIAKALGLAIDDLKIGELVPTIVQTEVAHVMVPIRDLQVLNEIKPDNEQLIELSKRYGFEGFYCFTLPGQDREHIAETRFFNPLIGIDEDAATGTAAGPLIGFLAMNGYAQIDKKYKILQGVKLKQPSLIETIVGEDGILVGGASIITMQGEIYL